MLLYIIDILKLSCYQILYIFDKFFMSNKLIIKHWLINYNYAVLISYWGKLICVPSVPTTQMYFSGTVTQFWDTSTILLAFRIPYPNALLTQNPAPFFLQPGLSFREEYSAVHVMICCISRHVRLGLKQFILSFIPSHSQKYFWWYFKI